MSNSIEMRQKLIEDRKQRFLVQLSNCDNTIFETDHLITMITNCNKILLNLVFTSDKK
jgi:hypothetical protein